MDMINTLLGDAGERSRRLGRPVVTLSYAQSLDGSLTSRPYKRLAISGEESKLMTHQLRAAHDAILVGIDTLLTDDPLLSARLAGGPHPQVVVLDSKLRTPITARVLQRTDLKALIFCGEDAPEENERALEKAGGRVLRVRMHEEGKLDLADVLAELNQFGLRSLMVEGGAEVITSFLKARLADQVVITAAPVWVGGPHIGRAAGSVEGCYPALPDPHYETYGRDLIVWGRLSEGRYEEQNAVFHQT